MGTLSMLQSMMSWSVSEAMITTPSFIMRKPHGNPVHVIINDVLICLRGNDRYTILHNEETPWEPCPCYSQWCFDLSQRQWSSHHPSWWGNPMGTLSMLQSMMSWSVSVAMIDTPSFIMRKPHGNPVHVTVNDVLICLRGNDHHTILHNEETPWEPCPCYSQWCLDLSQRQWSIHHPS